jgi:hypothetical protein
LSRPKTESSLSATNSESARGQKIAIITLQLLVGGLVTGGGIAFAYFAVNNFGTALGTIHFLIGIIALAAGIVALSRFPAQKFLIMTNLLVIAYSSVSELFVELQSLCHPLLRSIH